MRNKNILYDKDSIVYQQRNVFLTSLQYVYNT